MSLDGATGGERRRLPTRSRARSALGLFDAEKNETRHSIDGPEQIYRFAGELLGAVARYDGEAGSVAVAASA